MIDFPASPTVGQQYTSGTSTWNWDGTAWILVPVAVSANNIMPTQTGNAGRFLSTDGTNVSWQAPSAVEEVFITSGSAASTSTISFSNVFTSAYRDYRVQIRNISLSYVGKFVMIFRAGGTLYNSSVYSYAGYFAGTNIATTLTYAAVGGSRYYYTSNTSYPTTNGVVEMQIYRPQLATQTEWLSQSTMYSPYGAHEIAFTGGRYNGSIAFDGFLFQSETGQAFSADFAIYGRRTR